MHLERMILCLLTYVNGELACISGVDDVNHVKENTWRVLVRAATTPNRPKQISREWYEDNLYPWRGHAGFECAYIKEFVNPNAKFVVSTNIGVQSTRTIERWKGKFRTIDRDNKMFVNLWYTDQYLWPIDPDVCIEMGKSFFSNWKEIYDNL